jgi:hypothetical protein
MTAPHTELWERRLFPAGEQLVKTSTLLANHQSKRRTIEATMKGLPTNENTAKPELQYAARHSPRIESKKKAVDQNGLRPS